MKKASKSSLQNRIADKKILKRDSILEIRNKESTNFLTKKIEQKVRTKDATRKERLQDLAYINRSFAPFCHGTSVQLRDIILKEGLRPPSEAKEQEWEDLPTHPNRVYFGSIPEGFGGCAEAMENTIRSYSGIEDEAWLEDEGVVFIFNSIPEDYADNLVINEDCESFIEKGRECSSVIKSLETIGSLAIRYVLGNLTLPDKKSLNFVDGRREEYWEDKKFYDEQVNEMIPILEKYSDWKRKDIEEFIETHKKIFQKSNITPKVDIHSKYELDIVLIPNESKTKDILKSFNMIKRYFESLNGFEIGTPTRNIKPDFSLTPKEFFYLSRLKNPFFDDSWDDFFTERLLSRYQEDDVKELREKRAELFEDLTIEQKKQLKAKLKKYLKPSIYNELDFSVLEEEIEQ